MAFTSRKLRDGTTHVDATDEGWRLVVANVVGVAVAELTVCSVAPATHGASVEQRARVVVAGFYLRHRTADVHVIERTLVVTNGVGVAVAELPVAIVTPAAHVAPVEQRARVVVAS